MRTVHNVKDVSNPYLALMAIFPTQRPIAWTQCEGYVYRNPDTAVTTKRRVRRLEK